MARHPLEERIAALRGQVRRLVAWHGLSWVVLGAVLAILGSGLLDWAVHLAREVRLALLVGLVVLCGYLFARYVVAPLVVRFRDLDIALRIEQKWPGLNDRLASTVQFLHLGEPADPTAAARDEILGSRPLREATVAQTLAEVEGLDFREVIDARPVRRGWLAAGSAVAVALVPLLLAPGLSRIALERLFMPYGSAQWPKRTYLAIRSAPEKVARGEEFRLEAVVTKGRVPSSAKVTYRFEDGESVTEPLRRDPSGAFHGRIESASRSFRFTVAAGDDVTVPRSVTVVPPPAVTALTLRVVPPAYTGLGAQTMAPGRNQVQAVRGSRLEVSASTNKPVARALLRRSEEDPQGTPMERVSGDGRQLAAQLEVAHTATYTVELVDTEGFASQERDATRFEVRAQEDEAPRVAIDEPVADRDVTPNAEIPVQITADDDFGLGQIRLLWKLALSGSEPTQQEALALWSAEEGIVKHQQVEHRWDLTPLGLTPGSVITFHADARDRDDLRGPNLGKSREIRLRVVTPEEIARQLEAQQREIREAIARLAEMQEQALRPVEEARRTLEQAGALDPASRDNLNNAGIIQRQVNERITSRADGLAEKVRRFLEDLKDLKVQNPEVEEQMRQIRAGVGRIQDEHLDPAEQGLARATKALEDQDAEAGQARPAADQAQTGVDRPDEAVAKGEAGKAEASKAEAGKAEAGKAEAGKAEAGKAEAAKGEAAKDGSAKGETPKGEAAKGEAPADEAGKPEAPKSPAARQAEQALAQAGENQQAIADELQAMLENLKQFETYRGAVEDAKKLLRGQEEAMKAAADAQRDLTGKPSDQLDEAEKAKLNNLAQRQEELAKQLQGLQGKMDEMADRLGENDPLSASALKEATEQSRRQGTTGRMNEAAQQMRENQLGSARAGQEQSRQDLKELVDTLQNRREQELTRLVKELRETERALRELRERQARNRQQTGQARQMQDQQQRKQELQRLAKEQKELEQEARRQLQRLQKLRAEMAARAASRAAERMAQAGQNQEQDQGEGAEQEQEEALNDLDEAMEETRQARRQAEEQLAMEQLAKLADGIRALAERQEKVVADTADYQKGFEANQSTFTPAQRAGVRALARVQNALREETDDLAAKLEDAPVFSLALKRAAESMRSATERLQQLSTDEATQQAERSAARRFRQLLDALRPEMARGGQGGGGGGGGGDGGGGGGGGGDGITTEAQIKMLKLLQLDVNERTEAIDQIRQRKGELTPEQEAELAKLGEDQNSILDLARDLTRPRHEDGEED